MQLDAALVGVSSSTETSELYKALVKAQRTFKPIKRSGTNMIEGFRYATYADICNAVVPSLLEAGLSIPTFSMGFDKTAGRWVLVGTLCHGESDQWTSAVCPLLMGFGPEDRPGIQVMEAENTYAKKILMANLVGGWLESEDDEQPRAIDTSESQVAPEPKPAPEKPKAEPPIAVVKQAKSSRGKPVAKEMTVAERADAKLAEVKGDPAEVEKIFKHLRAFEEQGLVTKSDITLLAAKHKLDAKTTKVTEVPNV